MGDLSPPAAEAHAFRVASIQWRLAAAFAVVVALAGLGASVSLAMIALVQTSLEWTSYGKVALLTLTPYVLAWSWFAARGQTLGKWWAGLFVLRTDGTPAGFVRILVRSTCKWLAAPIIGMSPYLLLMWFVFYAPPPPEQCGPGLPCSRGVSFSCQSSQSRGSWVALSRPSTRPTAEQSGTTWQARTSRSVLSVQEAAVGPLPPEARPELPLQPAEDARLLLVRVLRRQRAVGSLVAHRERHRLLARRQLLAAVDVEHPGGRHEA